MSHAPDGEYSDLLASRYPSRATAWQLRSQPLTFDRVPRVMGILNVTPDSFSDGGKFVDRDRAVSHALEMVASGADLIDVGGESTRPYSTPVGEAEECDRVVPVIEAIRRETSCPISIDTSKANVARAACLAGAEVINDVTGLEGDPAMIDVAREYQVGVCAMHMQGTPQTMQDAPQYEHVVTEILSYLTTRLERLVQAGIESRRICLDPGIGFGKTHQHNLTLMASAGTFHRLGQPVLVGHSRKGFIAKVLGDADRDRTAGTVGAAMSLARQGIQVIRVHDVRAVRDALRLFAATGGVDGRPLTLSDDATSGPSGPPDKGRDPHS